MKFMMLLLSTFLSSQAILAQDQASELPVVDLRGMDQTMADLKVQQIVRQMVREDVSSRSSTQKTLQGEGILTATRPKSLIFLTTDNNCEQHASATFISAAATSKAYGSQKDKNLHSVAGGGLSIAVGCATNNPILGRIAGCAAGFGKEEFYDKQRPKAHTYDSHDFLATCAAGLGLLYKKIEF